MALRLALTEGPRTEAWDGSSISLEGKPRFVIGRGEQSDLVLQDAAKLISSHHCEIVIDGDGYVLCDTSTNGTFLNGAKERLAGAHRLADGDTIAIGSYVLRASLAAAAAPPPDWAAPGADRGATHTALHQAPPRGGDPAEMVAKPAALAADIWLNSAEGGAAASAGVTVIRPAPRRQPAPAAAAAQPAPVGPASALMPESARAPADRPDPSAVLARLAAGLGVAPSALAGMEPGDVAERLGRIAWGLAAGAKALLDETTRTRRDVGSRQFGLRRDPRGNPLKLSPTAEDALLSLLAMAPDDAAAAIARNVADMRSHQRTLLAAARDAARTLGDDLDPGALAGAVPEVGEGAEGKARLWDLYRLLWGGPEADWAACFVEVFMLRMASAYDAEGAGANGA